MQFYFISLPIDGGLMIMSDIGYLLFSIKRYSYSLWVIFDVFFIFFIFICSGEFIATLNLMLIFVPAIYIWIIAMY